MQNISEVIVLWASGAQHCRPGSVQVLSWCFENDPHSLQALDDVGWSAVEYSIAVVDPGQDQTTSQCLCQFRSQQVSKVSDGLFMVIACIIITAV